MNACKCYRQCIGDPRCCPTQRGPNLPPPIQLSQWLDTMPMLTCEFDADQLERVPAGEALRMVQRNVLRKLRAAGKWNAALRLSQQWGL